MNKDVTSENIKNLNHEKHERNEIDDENFRDFRAFRGYKSYKPSGVEWLGDVPEHWVVKRARFILSMNPSKQEISHLDPDTELAFLPMEAVGEEGSLRLDTTKPISEVSAGYTFFAEGDVTFAKITPCFENGKGAIMRNLGTRFGFGTTELTVMRPSENLDAEYLYYLSVSDDFRHNGEAWMYGAGGQKRVPDDFIKEFRFGFPPLLEQQAIAAFLDRETGRIDSLIAKKQRLLELLAEQRTALISRAVTRGLPGIVSRGDAEFAEWAKRVVKYKPSGVEWLEDVPEHWEVWKLAHLTTRIGSGKTPTGGADVYQTEGVIFLRSQNVYDTGLYLDDVVYIDEKTDEEMAWSRVQPKDILLNITGASLGRTCITPSDLGRANVNQHVCVIRFNKSDYANFIAQYLKSRIAKSFFDFVQTGSAREGLNFEQIGAFPIPLPPLSEQRTIAAFLDRETAKIDALSSKVITVIDRLKEYRTALISSAVTGKIDVRGIA